MKYNSHRETAQVDVTTQGCPAPSSISILAVAYNPETDRSYYEVEYPALNGSRAKRYIARELFETPSKVVLELKRGDAKLANALAEVKAAQKVAAAQTPPYHQLTCRTGWTGGSFIFPTETIGPLAGKLRYDDSPKQLDPALGLASGSLKGWREGLRAPCSKSDCLILAASLAASSALLELIGEEEGVCFHLHGSGSRKSNKSEKTRSTSGKSVATRVAISAVGRSKKTDLFSYDISPRAMEEFCFSHNNMTIGLDEEGRALEGAAQGRIRPEKLPYVIASGRGAVRSTKAMRDVTLENHTWCLNAISNGEYPLEQRQGERDEGAQLRQIGILVQPGVKGGIFNLLNGSRKEIAEQASQLMEQTQHTIDSNYGIALVQFVKALASRDRKDLSAQARTRVQSFVRDVEADTDPWEGRFARKFGVVYAAACLMSDFKIGPWTRKRARRAISRLYRIARRGLVSSATLADDVLSKLASAVQSGKFPTVKKGHKPDADPATIWGLTRKVQRERCILLSRSRFKRLVKPSASSGTVLKHLASRGILSKGADGKLTRQVMIGDKRRRYVCLKRSCLPAAR